MLEKGTRWRIGNVLSIRIWKDAWLGGKGSGKVISPPSSLSPDSTVYELFDKEHGGWNQELIGRIFLPFDVLRILKVP